MLAQVGTQCVLGGGGSIRAIQDRLIETVTVEPKLDPVSL